MGTVELVGMQQLRKKWMRSKLTTASTITLILMAVAEGFGSRGAMECRVQCGVGVGGDFAVKGIERKDW